MPKARPRRFDGDVNLPIFTDRAMESQGRPITQRDCASLNRALRLPPSTHLLVQGGGEIVDVASRRADRFADQRAEVAELAVLGAGMGRDTSVRHGLGGAGLGAGAGQGP